jgi:hypothetical protein
MLTAGHPSVSTALNELTATSLKYLKGAFTRTIQQTDIRMAIGVDDNRKVKHALQVRGTGDSS